MKILHYPAPNIDHGLQELPELLQRIYLSRGVYQPQDLEKKLVSLLPASQLRGITVAVELLYTALQAKSRILLIGDFDADGATSVALAVTALRAMGAKNVDYIVPDRFKYGYGLTTEIVMVAQHYSPDLLITVDNGISSCAGVTTAKQLGMKVLITDHHLAADELPAADAIVNPNQPGDDFPSKALAGVGVIFYVMLALRAYLREQNWFVQQAIAEPNMAELLDLVALGTVADVVPLDKNNRIFVTQGLARINASQCREGIKALLKIAKKDQKKITASDLGFAIGPRLNAAGRLEDMSLGIECLLTHDPQRALEIAERLDGLNEERKVIEYEMREQALQMLANIHLDKQEIPLGLCLFDDTWHQGVVGIVASRLKERYFRPVIAFAAVNEQELKGSARSIPGLHIRDTLDLVAKRYPALIRKFGGHAMAAGLSIERRHFEDFKQAFVEIIIEQLQGKALPAHLYSDGALTLSDLSIHTVELLQNAGPWGQNFPEPLFDGEFEIIEQRIVGQRHLKLLLAMEDKQFSAIAFNIDLQQWPNHRCRHARIAYRLDINEFNDLRKLQFLVEHIEAL